VHPENQIRRVILLVLDGVRPDAIEQYELPHLQRLMACGAASLRGSTVSPSVTTAAMTSLLSGVSPERHGIQTDRLFIPKSALTLSPIAEVLAHHGFPSSGFMGHIPSVFRGIAARVGRRLGFGTIHLVGKTASEILLAARSTIRTQRRGLILMHWPDADRAGHADGWMSPSYASGCRALDRTLGELAALTDVPNDPHTLLIALADHGGGGVDRRDHESAHPLDMTIPVLITGGGTTPCELEQPTLLDVPPTVLAALGAEIPASYEGRVLHEAIAARVGRAVAVA
jgi:predicted AlkP superfamily pyrophosphatase or phosphodiesterase